MPRRKEPARDYARRGVYIAGRLVWWRDSLGKESVPRICADEEDPEIVATELEMALDAADPVPAEHFSPPPLHERDRSHLRLL